MLKHSENEKHWKWQEVYEPKGEHWLPDGERAEIESNVMWKSISMGLVMT